MAKLVAVLSASHAPLITAAPETAPPALKERVYAGMERLRQALADARPTVLVICSNEHFTNFFLDNFPPACIGIAERHHGPIEPWLRVPPTPVPGQPALGTWILERSFEAGFDLPFSQDMYFDHGIMTVLHFLNPGMRVPTVPIIQNCSVRPMPSLRRCYELGRLIRSAVESWPADERVAVIGAGGLSHWVGVPEMGHINSDWDRWLLDRFERGELEEVLRLTDDEIEETAGNGAQEIRSWLTAAGAADGAPATVLSYAPVEAWATGMGTLLYHLPAA